MHPHDTPTKQCVTKLHLQGVEGNILMAMCTVCWPFRANSSMLTQLSSFERHTTSKSAGGRHIRAHFLMFLYTVWEWNVCNVVTIVTIV